MPELKIVPTLVDVLDPSISMREAAAAKFRELADKLESGELAGARVEWRPELALAWVELDYHAGQVRFRRITEPE